MLKNSCFGAGADNSGRGGFCPSGHNGAWSIGGSGQQRALVSRIKRPLFRRELAPPLPVLLYPPTASLSQSSASLSKKQWPRFENNGRQGGSWWERNNRERGRRYKREWWKVKGQCCDLIVVSLFFVVKKKGSVYISFGIRSIVSKLGK